MALYVKQENSRTELQNRIAAELQEKLKTNDPSVKYEKPESTLIDSTNLSDNLGPIVIIIVAVVGLGIAYLLLAR